MWRTFRGKTFKHGLRVSTGARPSGRYKMAPLRMLKKKRGCEGPLMSSCMITQFQLMYLVRIFLSAVRLTVIHVHFTEVHATRQPPLSPFSGRARHVIIQEIASQLHICHGDVRGLTLSVRWTSDSLSVTLQSVPQLQSLGCRFSSLNTITAQMGSEISRDSTMKLMCNFM